MKRAAIICLFLLVSIATFAFIPESVDFIISIENLYKLEELTPDLFEAFGITVSPNSKFYIFGKLSFSDPEMLLELILDPSEISELFSDEGFVYLLPSLQISLATNESEWITSQLQKIGHTVINEHPVETYDYEGFPVMVIESGELTYFSMNYTEITRIIAALKGEEDLIAPAKGSSILRIENRAIPLLGILLHFLGLNAGRCNSEEIAFSIIDQNIEISATLKKSYSDWELHEFKRRVLNERFAVINKPAVILFLQNMFSFSLIEEIGFDFDVRSLVRLMHQLEQFGIYNIVSSLSGTYDQSKICFSFEIPQDSVKAFVNWSQESTGMEISESGDSFILESEEGFINIPKQGGTGVIAIGAEKKDITIFKSELPENMLDYVYISSQYTEGSGDVLFYIYVSDDGSVVIKATLPIQLVKEILEEELEIPVPSVKSEQMNIINEIVTFLDSVDEESLDGPPRNKVKLLKELSQLEPVSDNIDYNVEEDEFGWLVTVSVYGEIPQNMSEEMAYDQIESFVDDIRVTKNCITIQKFYYRLDIDIPYLLDEFKYGIENYYYDYGYPPDTLEDLLDWYVYEPVKIFKMFDYSYLLNNGIYTVILIFQGEVPVDISENDLKDICDFDSVVLSENAVSVKFTLK